MNFARNEKIVQRNSASTANELREMLYRNDYYAVDMVTPFTVQFTDRDRSCEKRCELTSLNV